MPTYVAFAAGSNLQRLVGIVQERLAEAPGCKILAFYGNYGERDEAHLEELLALKDRHLANVALHFVMPREAAEGECLSGRLDGAKLRVFAEQLFAPRAVRAYFLAGPAALDQELGAQLQSLGVAAERIHRDGQTPQHSIVSAAAADHELSAAQALTEVDVVMDGRRRSFTMHTGTESILDAAARAGIVLPFSCRAGVCCTCRTKLVRGEVELAQNYALEDWELAQGFILACQAHAKTAQLELTYDET